MKELNFLHPGIFIGKTKSMGLGVFTKASIEAGTLIETAPVLVMTAADRVLLDQTLLHDYIFEWGEDRKRCVMALGYIPLYNHAYNSNCEYEMDYKKKIMSVKTVRAIKKGEELFINYNGDWDNDGKVVV